MRVAIIGAGLGGLASAIRLAVKGYQVEIFEKNSHVGGKACEKKVSTSVGEFRWDGGPSLLTMPEVLEELFQCADKNLAQELSLNSLSPACRYFWADGKVIDTNQEFWNEPLIKRYLQQVQPIYEISKKTFLNAAPRDWWKVVLQDPFALLRPALSLRPFQTLAHFHENFFSDKYLRQIFNRFATYNGSSPYRIPATFAIIPYVEAILGGWYPDGGIARIPEKLHQIAVEKGVVFHLGRNIDQLNELDHDVIVCNMDVISAHHHLIQDLPTARKLRKRELACSGYVVWLALHKSFPQLAHHNIFFSDDYEKEFREIFQEHRMPDEPTIYVAITSKTDARDAPTGCENWFILVNAPAYHRVSLKKYEKVIFHRLEKFGIQIRPADILHQETFTPRDFQSRDRAWEGSFYGWASHSPTTALLRPSLRHGKKQNLYFVGGTTHPGGGIPLVMLSGKMVAEQIQRDYPL